MPRQGNGVYVLPASTWNPATTGTTIETVGWNATAQDLASALTQSVSKDGQTTLTGNLPMGGYKLTGLADGASATDSATYGQTLHDTGNQSLSGNLSVNGNTVLSGDLTVTGAVIFSAGTLSLANLSVSSVASVASLNVVGTTNANILNVASTASLNTLRVASTAAIAVLSVGSSIVIGSASGGDKGAGTINAVAIYINGTAVSTSTAPYNYIAGCEVARVSSTVMRIAAGQLSDTTNAQSISVASTNVDFGVVGANGIDVGSIEVNKQYAIYVIAKADGTQAGLASLSFSAPTMPATYTVKRRVAFMETDPAVKNLLPLVQTGRQFRRSSLSLITGAGIVITPGAAQNITLTLPTGRKWPVTITASAPFADSASRGAFFSDPDATDQAPGNTTAPLPQLFQANVSGGNQSNTFSVVTDTSSRVRVRSYSGDNLTIYAQVDSYQDDGL